MGKMQRTKGATFERLVAGLFRQCYPESRRGIGQARSASEVPDVDVPGWWVECKHGKQPNWRAAMLQARDASKTSGRVPLVVTRDNNGAIYAHFELRYLLAIIDAVPPATRAMILSSRCFAFDGSKKE